MILKREQKLDKNPIKITKFMMKTNYKMKSYKRLPYIITKKTQAVQIKSSKNKMKADKESIINM
jgi:hypothetical protein